MKIDIRENVENIKSLIKCDLKKNGSLNKKFYKNIGLKPITYNSEFDLYFLNGKPLHKATIDDIIILYAVIYTLTSIIVSIVNQINPIQKFLNKLINPNLN